MLPNQLFGPAYGDDVAVALARGCHAITSTLSLTSVEAIPGEQRDREGLSEHDLRAGCGPVMDVCALGVDDWIYVAKYTVVKLERHAEQLAALGHVARVAILRAVVQAGPDGLSTTDLQEKLDIPWTTLTHHLDRVVEAGLVIARKEGKSVCHTADYKALRALTDFLWEDCCKGGKGSKNCC
jgi:ArsR family transcriptional regulator